jgi:hypothetical protein
VNSTRMGSAAKAALVRRPDETGCPQRADDRTPLSGLAANNSTVGINGRMACLLPGLPLAGAP